MFDQLTWLPSKNWVIYEKLTWRKNVSVIVEWHAVLEQPMPWLDYMTSDATVKYLDDEDFN